MNSRGRKRKWLPTKQEKRRIAFDAIAAIIAAAVLSILLYTGRILISFSPFRVEWGRESPVVSFTPGTLEIPSFPFRQRHSTATVRVEARHGTFVLYSDVIVVSRTLDTRLFGLGDLPAEAPVLRLVEARPSVSILDAGEQEAFYSLEFDISSLSPTAVVPIGDKRRGGDVTVRIPYESNGRRNHSDVTIPIYLKGL